MPGETPPSIEAVDEELNKANASIEAGTTRWPGMTYEQGVDAALRWACGHTDERPMED